jgi:hypothetical protein
MSPAQSFTSMAAWPKSEATNSFVGSDGDWRRRHGNPEENQSQSDALEVDHTVDVKGIQHFAAKTTTPVQIGHDSSTRLLRPPRAADSRDAASGGVLGMLGLLLSLTF